MKAPRQRRTRLAWLVAGVILAAAAALALRAFLTPPPDVTVPPDPAKLEPQLRAYVADQIRAVLAAPRDPQRRVALALTYAANGLWTEARRAFQDVVRLLPHEPLAHMYYAVACQELGEKDGPPDAFAS